MATSIHIPKTLLGELDRRARKLAISRNRLIVGLIQEGLARTTDWSPGFLEELETGGADQAAVDEMLQAIRTRRRSKKPPVL